jgi:hypothetical protein
MVQRRSMSEIGTPDQLTVHLTRTEKTPSTSEYIMYGNRIGDINVDITGSDEGPDRAIV